MTNNKNQPPSAPRWWISVDNNTQGLYTAPHILTCIKSGEMDGTTLACLEGSEQWKTLSEWRQFAAVGPVSGKPESAKKSDEDEVWDFTSAHDEGTKPVQNTDKGTDDWPNSALGFGVMIVVAGIGCVLAFKGVELVKPWLGAALFVLSSSALLLFVGRWIVNNLSKGGPWRR